MNMEGMIEEELEGTGEEKTSDLTHLLRITNLPLGLWLLLPVWEEDP